MIIDSTQHHVRPFQRRPKPPHSTEAGHAPRGQRGGEDEEGLLVLPRRTAAAAAAAAANAEASKVRPTYVFPPPLARPRADSHQRMPTIRRRTGRPPLTRSRHTSTKAEADLSTRLLSAVDAESCSDMRLRACCGSGTNRDREAAVLASHLPQLPQNDQRMLQHSHS